MFMYVRFIGRNEPRITPSLKLIAMLIERQLCSWMSMSADLTSRFLDYANVSGWLWEEKFVLDFTLLQAVHIDVDAICQKLQLAVDHEIELV
jgi:hypothetical protein